MEDIYKLIMGVAEKYGIDLEHPEKYDITRPSVARKVEEDIVIACRPMIEAWEKVEAASRAYAHNWIVGVT